MNKERRAQLTRNVGRHSKLTDTGDKHSKCQLHWLLGQKYDYKLHRALLEICIGVDIMCQVTIVVKIRGYWHGPRSIAERRMERDRGKAAGLCNNCIST